MSGIGQTLQLDGVRFSYGAMPMAFDLSVDASETVAVMGPSGSGKSTLLNLIAGFETPAGGRILVGGRDITSERPSDRPVSMIFQENNLFGHLDVRSNVALGRSPSLRLDAADHAAVVAALDRTGLGDKADRLPAQLSGGERQRAALARALIRRRPVLLMDEPFASLGPALRADMAALVADLQAETGMTMLLVTHAPDDAALLAARTVFVEDGPIAADGPTATILGDDGPAAVRRYLGERGGNAFVPARGHN